MEVLIKKRRNVMKIKNQKALIRKRVILICIFLLLFGACSNSDEINLVKNGILELDKSLTVGEAFENYKYFSDVKWEAFKTDNGRRVVQVTGILDLDKYPEGSVWKKQGIKEAGVIFQFLILKDGEHFEIHTYGLKLVSEDGREKTLGASEMGLNQIQLLKNLKEIYDNQPLS
jgi:hypothetical protein